MVQAPGSPGGADSRSRSRPNGDRREGIHASATKKYVSRCVLSGSHSDDAPWALLRHARPAWQVARGLPRLAEDVQVAISAAGVGADPADLLRLHRQLRRGAGHLRLLVLVPAPLPGDKYAASVEQGR